MEDTIPEADNGFPEKWKTFPLAMIEGPPGAGKTTVYRQARRLLTPPGSKASDLHPLLRDTSRPLRNDEDERDCKSNNQRKFWLLESAGCFIEGSITDVPAFGNTLRYRSGTLKPEFWDPPRPHTKLIFALFGSATLQIASQLKDVLPLVTTFYVDTDDFWLMHRLKDRSMREGLDYESKWEKARKYRAEKRWIGFNHIVRNDDVNPKGPYLPGEKCAREILEILGIEPYI